jgi:oxygen-dependent protoporphyrinogen oxidase
VVLATPARAAARLAASLDADAAAWIGGVDYAPIATVCLSAATAALRRPPSGFGFLVPRGEGRGLLGCLFMSELFADRAPEGRHLLHCMLGGARVSEVLELDDAELAALATEELAAPLGVVGDLEVLRVARWPRAVAQPLPGHRVGLRAARTRLASLGSIALAGGYTDGVSVADSFASGIAAARALTGDGADR